MKNRWIKMLKSMLGANKKPLFIQSRPESIKTDLMIYRLNMYMQEHKPYLKPRYRLKDLSDDMHMPLHQLSAFLNKRLGMHFSEYLNQFRIRYCEELIRNGSPGRIYLKELFSKCGFHNRNTFTTAFKKFTGKTPSEYVRERVI
jgi:YesN/AraC family two-component response regulator